MNTLLAALVTAPSSPDPLPGLRENSPPVTVPWPEWVWWAMGGAAVVVVAAAAIFFLWLFRRKAATLPPSPRFLARTALEKLRAQAGTMDAYAFGVAVSDVLRTYISRQFALHATQQTSPEFLASIATSARFTDAERRLLAAFLEQCDLRKYAHIQAADNEALLESAHNFLEGSARPEQSLP